MGVAATIVVVVAVVAVIVVLAWMFFSRQHPERASQGDRGMSAHRTGADPATMVDRPAGPDAEDQGVDVGDAHPGLPGPPP